MEKAGHFPAFVNMRRNQLLNLAPDLDQEAVRGVKGLEGGMELVLFQDHVFIIDLYLFAGLLWDFIQEKQH